MNLWWPNGYGQQPLYKLSVTYENESNHSNNTKTIFVGFREAKLVQDYVNVSNPNLGRSFYFAINGVPIFAKGSNYIPHSIFLEEAGNREVIDNLLSATKEVNMNILRVWGGGIYADDFFYEVPTTLQHRIRDKVEYAFSILDTLSILLFSNVTGLGLWYGKI